MRRRFITMSLKGLHRVCTLKDAAERSPGRGGRYKILTSGVRNTPFIILVSYSFVSGAGIKECSWV
jgi:hypothetical protein